MNARDGAHAREPRERPVQAVDEQPLRSALPACYRRLVEHFSRHHLHSYDVSAYAEHGEGAGSWTIHLRFGEGSEERRSRTFSADELEESHEELTAFYEEAARACQKRLVADYYKLMKP
jgi:hypothetical protein